MTRTGRLSMHASASSRKVRSAKTTAALSGLILIEPGSKLLVSLWLVQLYRRQLPRLKSARRAEFSQAPVRKSQYDADVRAALRSYRFLEYAAPSWPHLSLQ